MRVLHLHVCFEYFDLMVANKKPYEFREFKEYWRKRLSKNYDQVWVHRGYMKASPSTVIKCKWVRPRVVLRQHKHFGPKPVKVFAIPVTERLEY